MIKNFIKILFLILALQTIKISADEIKVNYYLDGELSLEIDAYYEIGSDVYPNIEGYEFKNKTYINGEINLYYETKKIKIIINGNGGLYNGLEEVVIGEINYGEEYLHNPLIINEYIFEKEDYILIKYESSFKKTITAYEDIYYYAKWQKQNIVYKFYIGSSFYEINQHLNNFINFPIINDLDAYEFLYFVDSENNIYDNNYVIENSNEKVLYAKFSNMKNVINITDTSISFDLVNDESISIMLDDIFQEGEVFNNKVIFNNLEPDTLYTFKIENKRVDLKTKEALLNKTFGYIKEGFVNLLLNKEYDYYFEDQKIIEDTYKYPVSIEPNITYKAKDSEQINQLTSLNVTFLNVLDNVNTSLKGNDLTINFPTFNNFILVSDGEFSFYNTNETKLEGVSLNSKYYVIVNEGSDYFYKEISLIKPNINYDVSNTEITIYNSGAHTVKFDEFESSLQEITISDLTKDTLYSFNLIVSEDEVYKYYFYTTNLKELSLEDLEIELYDNKIVLNNVYDDFAYALIESGSNGELSWVDKVSNKMTFNFLSANSSYDLYIQDYKKDKVLLGTLKTTKVLKENVITPLDKVIIKEVLESSVKIVNNLLYEFSVDEINWFNSEEETLIITNLEEYTKYYIYIRFRETNLEESSKGILGGSFKTLVKYPSLASFKDLEYDFKSISFSLLPGYNYYFNDELVSVNDFYITNLEANSTHILKVVRISDNEEFIKEITLKTVSNLTNEEKEVVILKTYETLKITNNKTNFKYILKDKNDHVVKEVEGTNEVYFSNLKSNTTYKLFILKEATLDVYYYEEYVLDIYLPKDMSALLVGYLRQYNIKQTKKVTNLINEYQEKSYEVLNKEEFDLLYNKATNELSKINKGRRTIIISSFSSGILVILISGYLVFFRKKVKK